MSSPFEDPDPFDWRRTQKASSSVPIPSVEEAKACLENAAIEAKHEQTGVKLKFVLLGTALQSIDALIAAVLAHAKEQHEESIIAWEGHGIDPREVTEGYSYSADLVRRKLDAVAEREREEAKQEIERLNTALEEELGNVEKLHDVADRLAYAIAPLEVIGEHSNMNDPWANAIEQLEVQQAERDALLQQIRDVKEKK